MKPGISPISVTTFFSLALHASLAVAIMQSTHVIQATGKGIEIELVSSSYVSNQNETEQAANIAQASRRQPLPAEQARITARQTGRREPATVVVAENRQRNDVSVVESTGINNDSGSDALTRSTNASQHKRSIAELLHAKISEHKQYPYHARRQRREGVARVGFVLHPDGSIDQAQLVHSSRTRTLDQAALDAVKSIEPFKLASDYLVQPEAFQVDVVFNVM